MKRDKKTFTGKLNAKMIIASCILLAASSGSATAEDMRIQLDPSALQQAIDKANTASAAKSVSTPAPSTVNQNKMEVDPSVMKAVDQKMLTMMEETMKETLSDAAVMQEMQEKVMAERMDSNFLRDSMQPAIMENMRGSMQEGGKGNNNL
jgi:hypothetical protein